MATGTALSDFWENEILDHVLSAATYTPPVTVYLALYTVAPTDAGGGTEVTGGSYARVAITNNATNFPAAVAGSKTLATAATFPAATANWGTIVAIGLFDAATAGNLLLWTTITNRAVNSGDTPFFAANALTFALD
jgi:hypothetical protein